MHQSQEAGAAEQPEQRWRRHGPKKAMKALTVLSQLPGAHGEKEGEEAEAAAQCQTSGKRVQKRGRARAPAKAHSQSQRKIKSKCSARAGTKPKPAPGKRQQLGRNSEEKCRSQGTGVLLSYGHGSSAGCRGMRRPLTAAGRWGSGC